MMIPYLPAKCIYPSIGTILAIVIIEIDAEMGGWCGVFCRGGGEIHVSRHKDSCTLTSWED